MRLKSEIKAAFSSGLPSGLSPTVVRDFADTLAADAEIECGGQAGVEKLRRVGEASAFDKYANLPDTTLPAKGHRNELTRWKEVVEVGEELKVGTGTGR